MCCSPTSIPSISFNSWLIFKIKALLCSKQWHHSCHCCPCVQVSKDTWESQNKSQLCKLQGKVTVLAVKCRFTWSGLAMKAFSDSVNMNPPLKQQVKAQECQLGLKLFLKRGLSVHTFTLTNIMAYVTAPTPTHTPACLVPWCPCLI